MWYQFKEVIPGVVQVIEPGHVSFFVLVNNHHATLIDSGLGLAVEDFENLLKMLNVSSFDVLNTHLHCDHIGMNHSADTIFVNELEWNKFQKLSDEKQILDYYDILKNLKKWPQEEVMSKTKDFSTKVKFVSPGEIIVTGEKFDAYHTPGHTSGHMIYVSHKYRCIFLGDLIYDGLIFANLPDSDFGLYLESLRLINQLAEVTLYELLPSHNSIPLDRNYIKKLTQAFIRIDSGEIDPIEIKGNSLFGPSVQYNVNEVRIQSLRKSIIKTPK